MFGREHNRMAAQAAAAVMAAAALSALTGCGDAAPGGGETTLVVTRDFGAAAVQPARSVPATAGLTAMRQLQASAEVATSYGGRFVDSIAGVKGNTGDGDDWLFYVDGVESAEGAAAVRLKPGQIVQWDYHRWLGITNGEAIVGAFPRPLSSRGVTLDCRPASAGYCATVAKQLAAAGAAPKDPAPANAVTVRVGSWDALKRNLPDSAADLSADAADNGAFATIAGARMQLLGAGGEIAATEGAGSGLVFATREGESVSWTVTGVDEQGVRRAIAALKTDALKNRFAVAATAAGVSALPLQSGDPR